MQTIIPLIPTIFKHLEKLFCPLRNEFQEHVVANSARAGSNQAIKPRKLRSRLETNGEGCTTGRFNVAGQLRAAGRADLVAWVFPRYYHGVFAGRRLLLRRVSTLTSVPFAWRGRQRQKTFSLTAMPVDEVHSP